MNWQRIMNIATVATVAALAACSGSGEATTGIGGGNDNGSLPPRTVAATAGLAFTPATLRVSTGDAVTFAFGSVGHNVVFTTIGAPSNIGGVNANVSVQRTFSTPGTFDYQCTIHPFMMGTVVVQ